MRPICVLLVLAACEPDAPVQSDPVGLPYLFTMEFALEADDPDLLARARLHEWTEDFDLDGETGAVALSGDDALYADDVALTTETRSSELGVVDVSYSAPVTPGQAAYRFELRRGDGERISAPIAPPGPLEITPPGEVPAVPSLLRFSWSPAVDGATVDLSLLPLTDGCLTVLGGGEAPLVRGIPDTGGFELDALIYHSPDHDCDYELIVRRRLEEQVPADWIRGGRTLPANDAYAVGLRTARVTFTALQRTP